MSTQAFAETLFTSHFTKSSSSAYCESTSAAISAPVQIIGDSSLIPNNLVPGPQRGFARIILGAPKYRRLQSYRCCLFCFLHLRVYRCPRANIWHADYPPDAKPRLTNEPIEKGGEELLLFFFERDTYRIVRQCYFCARSPSLSFVSFAAWILFDTATEFYVFFFFFTYRAANLFAL